MTSPTPARPARLALVTGGAGFLGRRFAHRLGRGGYAVVVVDVLEGETDPYVAHYVRSDCRRFFAEHVQRFDLVVHCAARAPHRAAIDNFPWHMAYDVSLDSTLLNWAFRTRQPHVLYVSSSAAYPYALQMSGQYVLREDDVGDFNGEFGTPDSTYGWTKLIGERMALAQRTSDTRVTIVRPFSGYGSDQSVDFPFRALLERVRRRENPIVIWGDADQVRDWIHVEDVVSGALAVVNATDEVDDSPGGGPVNLCTGIGTSMRDLVRLMVEAVDESDYDPEIVVQPDAPLGVRYRVGDPALLSRSYVPTITIAEGVAMALRTGV